MIMRIVSLNLCFVVLWFSYVPFTGALPIGYSKVQITPAPVKLLEYNPNTPYAKFSIPLDSDSHDVQNQRSLIFELQAEPNLSDAVDDVHINDNKLRVASCATEQCLEQHMSAKDTDDVIHDIKFVISVDTTDTNTRRLQFQFQSVDNEPTISNGFSLITSTNPHLSFKSIIYLPDGSITDITPTHTGSRDVQTPVHHWQQSVLPDAFMAEAESLIQLEAEVEALSKLIVEKRRSMGQFLQNHRDGIPISEFLAECRSLSCVVQVVAQRICDKIGFSSEPLVSSAKISAGREMQNTFTSQDPQSGELFLQQKSGFSMMLKQNSSSEEYTFVQIINPSGLLIRSLQIFTFVLGLIALFAIIHNRSSSSKTRESRAANRHASRTSARAAYRSALRKKWNAFRQSVHWLSFKPTKAMEPCNEKRALILQDAFLEEAANAEQAEKGQIMEAEIRQLRHAHDIVASLVRVHDLRLDLVNDPPPSLVPLPSSPYTRSRASTQTLPPYSSEVLPGYASASDEFSGSETPLSPFSERSLEFEHGYFVIEDSRRSPTSSVLDVSPRPSQETIWDQQRPPAR